MHQNEKLLERFYACFSGRDAEGMWNCYTPSAHFSDCLFGELRGEEIRAMWHMLCEGGADLELSVRDISADDQRGRAHWDANYTFQHTGRHVRNRVDTSFRFRNGLIEDHRDSFSAWRWMSMALGWRGALLGWTPQARARAQFNVARRLESYARDITSSREADGGPPDRLES